MTDGPENYPPQDPSAFPPPGGGAVPPPGGAPGNPPPQAPQTPPFDGGFQQPVYPGENPAGQQYPPQQYQDPYGGGGYGPGPQQDNKKITAGILAILLGGFGIHKFILGYSKEGIIQIVLTFVTCGIASIIPLIEGIIYLTKSDEEFYQTYQVGQKTWF